MGTVNPDLDALLWSVERNLMEIVQRQYVMEAFTAALERVTRGNPFRIRNGVVWMLMLDTRDMLVVHLASWAKGVLQEDVGLLSKLQADHLGSLPRALPKRDRKSDEPEWAWHGDSERRDREHAEAFTRLFPNAGAQPDGAAIDELRKVFLLRMKALFKDRNWNRAQAFEKVRGTTAMLDFSDLRALIAYAEQFLGDIAMVGCHSMTDRTELNVPSAEDFAPEIVDVLLLGDSERAARLRGQLTREDFYAQLHERYEAAPPRAGDHFFNDT